ncbi:MAG: DUF2975 domain-containing protein [Acidobacteria bacterium]|nr:DUF2975 domain-containing protein [Acidobacteriota bacterium]
MNNSSHLQRIAALSRGLRWVIWFFLAVTVITTVFVIAIPSTNGMIRVGLADDEAPLGTVGLRERLTIVAVMAPAIAIWLGLFWTCERLFALYERGVVFERRNAQLIRRLGQLVIGLGVVYLAQPFLVSSLIDRAHVEVSTGTLGVIAIGAGVIAVGHVMSLAAEMAEESELTV